VDSSDLAVSNAPAEFDDDRGFVIVRLLRTILYANCVLTDFAAFLIIFVTSRGLADRGADPSYLGIMGAGLSLTAGLGSILGGWLSARFDGKLVFLYGAVSTVAAIAVCSRLDPLEVAYIPAYWSLGISLGCIYPPLIGWLNYGADVETDQRGVSSRLIFYCVAWNIGMMVGQLTGGTLYQMGDEWSWNVALRGAQESRDQVAEPGGRWIWNAALVGASLNVAVAIAAVSFVRRLPSVVRIVTESSAPPAISPRARLFKRLGWIANLGGVFGGSLVLHLLPDLMVDLGISPDSHGRMLAFWRVVVIAMYLAMHFGGYWHYRFGVSVASQLLGAAGLLCIGIAHSPVMLLIGLALLGQLVGFNYFSSLYYSTTGAAQESRAFAAGIHEATLAAGMALGTLAGGYVGSLINNRLPYQLSAAVIGVLVVWQACVWSFSERGALAP
jgi:MFS family permease